jgi:hypothetical protein
MQNKRNATLQNGTSTCNLQPATCDTQNGQHNIVTTKSMQRQRETCNMQKRRQASDMQQIACDSKVKHATDSVHHAATLASNIQHPTSNTCNNSMQPAKEATFNRKHALCKADSMKTKQHGTYKTHSMQQLYNMQRRQHAAAIQHAQQTVWNSNVKHATDHTELAY